MIQWLSENIGTIVVAAVLILVVWLTIRKLIRDKRSGKGCSCSCDGCSGCCKNCRSTENTEILKH